MRAIVVWFRQIFCNHEWAFEEHRCVERNAYTSAIEREGIKVSKTCKKCSYHKSYWKF